jgi:hypothetical protein
MVNFEQQKRPLFASWPGQIDNLLLLQQKEQKRPDLQTRLHLIDIEWCVHIAITDFELAGLESPPGQGAFIWQRVWKQNRCVRKVCAKSCDRRSIRVCRTQTIELNAVVAALWSDGGMDSK